MQDFCELKQAIGGVILRRRLLAGMSQAELAGKAGLEQSYLSLLEHGKRMPGIEIIYRFAAAFGIKPLTLLGEIDRKWREPVSKPERKDF